MSEQAHPRDKWIPWYFVAAFLLLFVVEAILVTIAVTTQTGVVTEKAYEHGLNYNDYIEDAEKQAALGWSGKVVWKDGLLQFTLHDKSGQPLTSAVVKAHFTRPVQAGFDFSATLVEQSAGIYVLAPAFPKVGDWNVKIAAAVNGQIYNSTEDIMVDKLLP